MFNPSKGQCHEIESKKKLGAMQHSRDHEKLNVFHCFGKKNVDVVKK